MREVDFLLRISLQTREKARNEDFFALFFDPIFKSTG